MKAVKTAYGAAAASYREAGKAGVLHVEITGPVTPCYVTSIRRDIAHHALEMNAGAVLVCLQKALVGLSLEQLLAEQSDDYWLPAAIVTAQPMLATYQAYAWCMAQEGYLRGAFVNEDQALSWVASKIGLGRRPARQAGQVSHAP